MRKILFITLTALFPIISQAEEPLQACQKALEAKDFASAAQTAASQNSYDGAMCVGHAQHAMGDYSAAELSFTKAEKLITDKFSSMLAITFLARSAHAAGKPDEALTHYERSLKLAEEINLSQGKWTNLNEIGQIYQEKKNYKIALEHFKDAHSFASNDNERSESNQLIALAYHQSGDNDQAVVYQLKSTMLEERSGDADQFLNAKLKLALYAMDGKDYKRSNNELSYIIKVSKEVKSIYWEARATLYQSQLERLLGNLDNSKALLKSATSLANKSGIQSLIKEAELGMMN